MSTLDRAERSTESAQFKYTAPRRAFRYRQISVLREARAIICSRACSRVNNLDGKQRRERGIDTPVPRLRRIILQTHRGRREACPRGCADICRPEKFAPLICEPVFARSSPIPLSPTIKPRTEREKKGDKGNYAAERHVTPRCARYTEGSPRVDSSADKEVAREKRGQRGTRVSRLVLITADRATPPPSLFGASLRFLRPAFPASHCH